MRTLSKQSNRHPSLTSRLATSNSVVLTRRTIDVFIIEGKNLTAPGSINKLLNPYVRLKFGANKKYRTQVWLFDTRLTLFILSPCRQSNPLFIPNGINHLFTILLLMNFHH